MNRDLDTTIDVSPFFKDTRIHVCLAMKTCRNNSKGECMIKQVSIDECGHCRCFERGKVND